jgi:hypothetical protein
MLATLLCSLILSCTPQYDGITSWGTKYVIDPQKVTLLERSLHTCTLAATEASYLRPEDLRSAVEDCYWRYWDDDKIGEVYYFYTGQQEDGVTPFVEFDICMSGLSSHMWDFPDDSTVESFRQDVRDCLNQFPKH